MILISVQGENTVKLVGVLFCESDLYSKNMQKNFSRNCNRSEFLKSINDQAELRLNIFFKALWCPPLKQECVFIKTFYFDGENQCQFHFDSSD